LYEISEAEIDDLVKNVEKKIEKKVIDWDYDSRQKLFKFKVRVECGSYPLRLIGTYNPRTGNYSFTLLLKDKRIRGLDIGKMKLHRNLDGTLIRGNHKHKWKDDSGSKYAYVPDDIDFSSIEKTFKGFLKECNIEFDGKFRKPIIQKGLL